MWGATPEEYCQVGPTALKILPQMNFVTVHCADGSRPYRLCSGKEVGVCYHQFDLDWPQRARKNRTLNAGK